MKLIVAYIQPERLNAVKQSLYDAEIFKMSDPVTLQKFFGWVNAPFAWLMGVPPKDCLAVGQVLGERIVLNEKYEELRRETLLVDMHQRMRDVRQGPDGFLYVATEERDGVVLRIRPAQ